MPPAGVLSGRRGALVRTADTTPRNATCSGSAITTGRSAFVKEEFVGLNAVKQEFAGLNTRVSPRQRPQEGSALSARVEQQQEQQQQQQQHSRQKNTHATTEKPQPPARKSAPAKAGGSSRTGSWSTRICNEPGCTTVPSYGAPGTKRQFCLQVGGRPRRRSTSRVSAGVEQP